MLSIIEKRILNTLLSGGIIVYPTDTIYGIGCDAFNSRAVENIFAIKNRDLKNPVSLLYPNMASVEENFYTENIDLKKYVGAYTLLLKPKSWIEKIDSKCFYKDGYVGVRVIPHWISKVVEKLGNPIITTSANVSGSRLVPCDINNVDIEIIEKVDLMIYEGPLQTSASKVINPYTGSILRG